jgi:glycosyltransferase involved in cell wall biosynthesis
MRISLIGPVYPYRGGIAQHTALLSRHLAECHAVQLISFSRQYPRWLIGGRSDRDPSQSPIKVQARYLLDPLNPLTWWRVAGQVRQWQPDLLILPWWVTFWAPAWFVLARLTHRWTHARVLFLCHNVLPHDAGPGFNRWLTRLALGQGDLYLAQSAQQLQTLHELAPARPATWALLPSFAEVGADGRENSAGHALQTSLGLPAGQAVLLFFGFVRPYKGLAVLLEALPAVLSALPVHLLVVGEIWGDPSQYLAKIERLGLVGHVTFVNEYVPDERLAEFFEMADVVVLPYLSATQSGVVPLAFSFGVPVIASRVGGLVDAVRDGITGLLVPPADPPALAQAIVRFFEQDLGSSMRAAIVADQARFSWQSLIDAIESLVDQRR